MGAFRLRHTIHHLTGTVEDWRKIRTRVDAIGAFGMDAWCRSLAPIADQCVRAASGDVDSAFWKRVYSPIDAYGGRVVTGWIARLYPYLSKQGATGRPNPLLEPPIDEPRNITHERGMLYHGPGVGTDSVPATLSRAIVNVNDQVDGENRAVALHAGLVGVAQDDGGALRPIAGWHVTPAPLDINHVIDRIVREHEVTPPQPTNWLFAPADLIAVYDRIGSATLFNGAWRLRPPPADHHWVRRGYGYLPLAPVVDLADGRSVCAAIDFSIETVHWVACRVAETLLDDPADVPVYGTSLAMLLDAALDSGGDFAHLETGRLNELDRATD